MNGIGKNLRALWQIFGAYRIELFILVVLGLLGGVVEAVGINAAIPLISFFVSPDNIPVQGLSHALQSFFHFFSIPFSFRYVLALILILFTLRALIMVVFGYLRGRITGDFMSSESRLLLERMLGAEWGFMVGEKIGHIHNTITRDVQRAGNLLESVSQVIQSFSGFLMYFVFALLISPKVTLFTVVAGGLLLVFVRPLVVRLRRMGSSMADAEKSMAQFLSEHIIGMKTIKASGMNAHAFRVGAKKLTYLRDLYVRVSTLQAMSTSVFQPFGIFFIIILFSIEYHSSSFSLIAFGATLYLIQKMFIYLESGQGAFNSVSALLPYAEHISAYKAELALRAEQSGGIAPFAFLKSIEFKDVSFSYGAAPVLSGISLSIPRGNTVALIGPSGGGKTSVADLLLRLFTPTQGTLSVDGAAVDAIPLADWRQHIGYVPQDTFLLNASIEENIRFYRSALSKEAIVDAAKQANIHEFIESLPQGYGSEVGDRGVMLSGGQRQRIALARALAGNPDFLILDEATSALDAESERLVQESIHALHRKTTVFVIAHRLSTIQDADHIYVLDQGRIVEEGSPSELARDPKSYFFLNTNRAR